LVAVDEGVFDLLDQPVSPQDTQLTVVATTPNGIEASDRSPISVTSGERALILNASPASGEAPLATTLSAFLGVPAFPIDRIDFDTDGDGTLDIVGAPAPQAAANFPAPRLARPRVFATTSEGVELSASTGINSHLPPVVHREFAIGNPVDLAEGPDSGLYVLDGAAATITLYDVAGSVVRTFGSSGAGAGQMSRPQGLAVAPNGDVYVADTGNDRVQVYAATGAHLRTLGASGSAVGQFREPSAIAFADDQLLVADRGNARLQILELDGSPTRSPELPLANVRGLGGRTRFGVLVASPAMGLLGFGGGELASVQQGQPNGPGDFPSAPVDAALADGQIWVAEGDEDDLLIFDDQMLFQQRVPVGRRAIAIAGSPRRNAAAVFIADGQRVTEVSASPPSPLPVAIALRDHLAADRTEDALQVIHPLQRDTFRGLYAEVGAQLAAHAADMTNFQVDLLKPDRAIVRFDAPSTVGGAPVVKSFPIYLTRQEDGSWLIADY
jgi:hypothetical protein